MKPIYGDKIEQIMARALHIFVDAYGAAAGPLRTDLQKIGEDGTQQMHVDWRIPEADLALAVDEHVDRFIRPAVNLLARTVPSRRVFGELPLPVETESARRTFNRVSLRLIAAWHSDPIYDLDGDLIGYAEPLPVVRVDVLTAPP